MTDTDRIAQMAREADCLDGNDEIFICDTEAALRFARLVAEDCAQIVGDAPMSSYRALEMAQRAIRARYSKE